MSNEISRPVAPASVLAAPTEGGWPGSWWRLMQVRIGYIPLPVAVLLLATLLCLGQTGALPGEISAMIAILGLAACVLAEIGRRIPLLNQVGGPVILCTFVPAYLIAHHLMPAALVKPIAEFWKTSNFLYLYIATIIVGSILSMDRTVLIRGFLKIFVPLAAGSAAAALVGTAVGWLLGLGVWHSFFFVVIPIMAGGLGEGAIPLTVGYADILHVPQGELLAQVLPPIMLGNLLAIVLAGLLNVLGRRHPAWTGNGQLQSGDDDGSAIAAETAGVEREAEATRSTRAGVETENVAGALIMAMTLYLLGILSYRAFGLPGPVTMLFLTVMVKLARAVPPALEAGARSIYRFSAIAVTYPLLFAIGTVITPWDQLVAAFSLASLVTVVATVVTIAATASTVGRAVGMYPIDTAVVVTTHSGMGGTGDVAILTAANRMQLMPFAQIATRIGGAITVTLILILLAQIA